VRQEFPSTDERDMPFLMEYVLDGMAQNFLITKMVEGGRSVYTDSVSHMMDQLEDDEA
jgi:hypothetical protein